MLTSSVAHTQNVADQAIGLANRLMTQEEQERSDAVRVVENLSCVCEDALLVICEAVCGKTASAIRRDRAGQSEEASVPQSHPNDQRLAELERQRKNLLFLVCRILQAAPEYKLRPSELAVENVGDLSCLSREARACLSFRMMREIGYKDNNN